MDEFPWKWAALGFAGLSLLLSLLLILEVTAPPPLAVGERRTVGTPPPLASRTRADSVSHEDLRRLEEENANLKAQIETLLRVGEATPHAQETETALPSTPEDLGRALGQLALRRQALRAEFPDGPPSREDPRYTAFIRGQQELVAAAVPITAMFHQKAFADPKDVAAVQSGMLTEALGLNTGQSNQIEMAVRQVLERYAAAGVTMSAPPEGVDRRVYFQQLNELRKELNEASKVGLNPAQAARFDELGLTSPWRLGRF